MICQKSAEACVASRVWGKFFVRWGLSQGLLLSSTSESLLICCFTAWCGSCISQEHEGTGLSSPHGPIHHWLWAAQCIETVLQPLTQEGPEGHQGPRCQSLPLDWVLTYDLCLDVLALDFLKVLPLRQSDSRNFLNHRYWCGTVLITVGYMLPSIGNNVQLQKDCLNQRWANFLNSGPQWVLNIDRGGQSRSR